MIMRLLMGETSYNWFIDEFSTLPLKERTIILPSVNTAITMQKKEMILILGNRKQKRKNTESPITWADIAKEIEKELDFKMTVDQIIKIYDGVSKQAKEWLELGYGVLFTEAQETKFYQTENLIEDNDLKEGKKG